MDRNGLNAIKERVFEEKNEEVILSTPIFINETYYIEKDSKLRITMPNTQGE